MYNVAYRPLRPPSISELLQGATGSNLKVKENNKGGITRPNIRDNVGFKEQTFELALPPSTHSSRLYQFYHQLEGNLQKPSGDGFIGYVSHSRRLGTTFIVRLTPMKNQHFLQALSEMPEVKKVTEEPEGGNAYPGTAHKLSILLAQ